MYRLLLVVPFLLYCSAESPKKLESGAQVQKIDNSDDDVSDLEILRKRFGAVPMGFIDKRFGAIPMGYIDKKSEANQKISEGDTAITNDDEEQPMQEDKRFGAVPMGFIDKKSRYNSRGYYGIRRYGKRPQTEDER